MTEPTEQITRRDVQITLMVRTISHGGWTPKSVADYVKANADNLCGRLAEVGLLHVPAPEPAPHAFPITRNGFTARVFYEANRDAWFWQVSSAAGQGSAGFCATGAEARSVALKTLDALAGPSKPPAETYAAHRAALLQDAEACACGMDAELESSETGRRCKRCGKRAKIAGFVYQGGRGKPQPFDFGDAEDDAPADAKPPAPPDAKTLAALRDAAEAARVEFEKRQGEAGT